MSGPVLYRPAAGRRVRHADGRALSDDGEAITMTPYWARLLADGDIEPVPAVKRKTRPISKTSQGSTPS